MSDNRLQVRFPRYGADLNALYRELYERYVRKVYPDAPAAYNAWLSKLLTDVAHELLEDDA